jgi:hypothetical protein
MIQPVAQLDYCLAQAGARAFRSAVALLHRHDRARQDDIALRHEAVTCLECWGVSEPTPTARPVALLLYAETLLSLGELAAALPAARRAEAATLRRDLSPALGAEARLLVLRVLLAQGAGVSACEHQAHLAALAIGAVELSSVANGLSRQLDALAAKIHPVVGGV